MIYTKQTKLAMQISFDVHKEQKDKTGLPYIYHPTILADSMQDELTTTVALLHDVVEDGSVSFEDLIKLGISKDAVDVIKVLTRRVDESYEDYILRVKKNKTAKIIKLADLNHNMDTSRLDCITEKDIIRNKKYQNAVNLLTK